MPQKKRELIVADWTKLAPEIRAVNKQLADIIDEISPDKSFKLVKASYKYGDITVKHGTIQLPDKNDELISLFNDNIDKEVKRELDYHSMPPFLILDKCNEIFIDTGNRVIPLNLFNKGWISGVYEFMDILTGLSFKYDWNFSAGPRSVFMLPKIYDSVSLNRLYSEYHIPSSLVVNNLNDHWNLFKHIAQSEYFDQDWTNQIVYFGHKWFKKSNDSAAWQKFRDYFTKQGWLQAQYSIAKINFALEWEKYAEAITLRRLHPKLYILDQLRHLLSLANGYYPGFIPANNSQEIAPTEGLKKAFIDIYQLKEYMPTIMHASSVKHFIHEQPVYYSLSLPTLIEGSPIKKSSSTILVDLRQLQILIETVKNYLQSKDIYNGQAYDSHIIANTKFDYFHVEKDKQDEIMPSSEICKQDPNFLRDEIMTNRTFCSRSPFFRGCVRIISTPGARKHLDEIT